MNSATYSPALIMLYGCILLWMTMDLHFRDLTPAQKWWVPLLAVSLAAGNHMLRELGGRYALGLLIPLTMHFPVFFLFLYLTKCGFIKMLFMGATTLVFAVPIVLVTTFFKQVIPLDSPLMLLINLAACAVMLLIVRLVFQRGFHYLLKYGDNRLLALFCLVPLLYYAYILAAANVDFTGMSSVNWITIRALPTFNVYVFYFLLLYNYRELSRRHELETAQAALSQELDAAAEQLVLLNETQTQAAVYRHDMRHHLNMLSGYLAEGKTAQAEDYIRDIQAGIEAITPRRYCENEAVDLLCSSFAGKAERMGVRLEVEAGLPETLSLPDTELCALISNGLENALNAAAGTEDKWVEFFCGIRANKLLVEIKNPYCGQVTLRDGLPVSNRQGHGYGCYSIKTIAERCHGMYSFQPEDGVFTLRVVLPL